jgi:hypothetical protein
VKATDSEVILSLPHDVALEQDDPRIDQVRELAYSLYEARGRIDGHDVEDWLEAEAIIRQERKLAA